jgi:hypothetical protein
MTNLALAEPFIASDAAVVFWSFSTTGKGKAPLRLLAGNVNNNTIMPLKI